jgi:hypothetical protein
MTPSELENNLLERSQQSIRIMRNLRENMTPSQIKENRILRKNLNCAKYYQEEPMNYQS